ncbi:hypothetical protein P4U90_16215 [Cytobacillus kochii]|uniref:hypothetical protein n=1 Tax=Cytobacillus kochii TaxID=859143 RepID=UPI002E1AE7C2|nr:hypothetical protein [Cytobacillus kochii]
MKKSNLFLGLIYLLLAVICLAMALLLESRLEGLLFSFAGAGIASGTLIVLRYFYWSADNNKDKYAEKKDIEHIELHDERKQKLREQSGRYAYILGLVIVLLMAVIISILGMLGIITNVNYTIITTFLLGYLVFQYIIGVLIYRHLNEKY